MTRRRFASGAARPSAAAGPARDRAVAVLQRVLGQGEFAAELLGRLQSERPIAPHDAALAEEIVLGVLRHRLTIDHIAAAFFQGQYGRVARPLRTIIAIAVYQLCWLDRVPDYAAVNAAVEQGRAVAGRKAGGMVNAVLRSMLRTRGERRVWDVDVDFRRWLSVDDTSGYEFSRLLWPDSQADPVSFLSLTMSHPAWAVARWRSRFGDEGVRQICRAGQARPPLVVRVNRRRIAPAELAARIAATGACVRVDAASGAVAIRMDRALADLSEFQMGWCQPQDATAQGVWSIRPPRPGEVVLDLCAGRGTKATHAAELMDDRGRVIASDRDPQRLRSAAHDAERLGLSCVECVPAAELADRVRRDGLRFDVILVDAPCSNSGALSRRPEARERLDAAHLSELSRVQAALLDQAVGLAGEDTDVIYSTCSIEPEENEDAVTAMVRRHAGWRVENSRLTLPASVSSTWWLGDRAAGAGFPCDGGFVALLRRRSPQAV